MKLHPRTLQVRKAAADIKVKIDELQIAHDLSDVEMLGVLLEVTASITKYLLRTERHPDDPDRKADEA